MIVESCKLVLDHFPHDHVLIQIIVGMGKYNAQMMTINLLKELLWSESWVARERRPRKTRKRRTEPIH